MSDDALFNLKDHPLYANAMAVLPTFARHTRGHAIRARACDDGSIELRVRSDGWRALAYLEPEAEESGWVWVCLAQANGEAPELEVGSLDEMEKLGRLLDKWCGAAPS